MFIGIAGIIGAGKSTLSQQLAERLGYDAFNEPVDDNPYLSDFYGDMNRIVLAMNLYLVDPHVDLIKWWPIDGNNCWTKLPSRLVTYDPNLSNESSWVVFNKKLLKQADYDYLDSLVNREIVISNSSYFVVKADSA